MCATIAQKIAKLFALVVIAFCAVSCGGGTTGTSPTDSLKFSGYADQANGGRAPFLSMTVSSGTSGESLKDSGTNAQGDFAMVLPSAESSLVVNVVGVGSTTMRRQQEGPGTLSAKLSATSEGLKSGLQFESQVREQNLCTDLSVSGDELIVTGDNDQVPCPVTIAIASQQLTLRDFEGSVMARCTGELDKITAARASSDGRLTLDLSAALQGGCEEIRIVISHPQAPGLESLFFVK